MNAFKHLDPKHLEDMKAVIEEYWKELFETLQRRLLLSAPQKRPVLLQIHATVGDGEFCKRNHALLALQVEALEASQDMTRRIKQEKE